MSDGRRVHNAKANKKKSIAASAAQKEAPNGGYYTSSVFKMPKGDALEARLKMVVNLAKAKEKLGLLTPNEDVMLARRGLFSSGRVFGKKL